MICVKYNDLKNLPQPVREQLFRWAWRLNHQQQEGRLDARLNTLAQKAQAIVGLEPQGRGHFRCGHHGMGHHGPQGQFGPQGPGFRGRFGEPDRQGPREQGERGGRREGHRGRW